MATQPTVKLYRPFQGSLARRRLRMHMAVYATCMLALLLTLFRQGQDELTRETARGLVSDVDQLVLRIESSLQGFLSSELEREFSDYGFVRSYLSQPSAIRIYLGLSPLASSHFKPSLPGVLEYLQITPDGTIELPILPPEHISSDTDDLTAILGPQELALRHKRKKRIAALFCKEAPGSDCMLKTDMHSKLLSEGGNAARARSREETVVRWVGTKKKDSRLSMWETSRAEVSYAGFFLVPVDNEHFFVYRLVHLVPESVPEQTWIQGMIVSAEDLTTNLFEREFNRSASFNPGSFGVQYKNQNLKMGKPNAASTKRIEPDIEAKIVVNRSLITKPFDDFSVLISLPTLDVGPVFGFMKSWAWITLIVLLIGVFLIYRLASNQIALAEERSNFVSAISHELKTPLTSIRMYAEMLMNGWVQDENKRMVYYEYIVFEAERLTRLVTNVLHLGQLSRGALPVKMQSHEPDEILKKAIEKIRAQVEGAGFKLSVSSDLHKDQTAKKMSCVLDEDSFFRIMINFADNALKFAKDAQRKEIEIGCRVTHDPQPRAVFFVRDFGHGVPEQEAEKIFEPFYRSGDELVRKTVGTGLGLAIVVELSQQMSANVGFENRTPGAEFYVAFPLSYGAG